MPIPIPPGAIPVAKKILTLVGPVALKEAQKYWSTNQGSKVKRGAYQECPIEMFGDKACIVVNEDSGEVAFLTSDTIQSYHYVKEKRKAPAMHTYFYYDIVFKDGSESYVRMRRKYRDAMLSHM